MIGDAAAAALALLVCYLVGAFIGWSWRPVDWDSELRILIAVIGVFVAMGAVCARRGVA